MSPLKVGSQCTGYGGMEMALQRHLDAEHGWHAEVDPAAAQVLAHHYPAVPNHGDITTFNWATAEPVPVVTACWPCQPISGAGPQLGSSDKRHLWPYVAASLTILRPALFVGENVDELLRIEGGAMFGQVLTDLDRMGYAVSWTTVGACAVGASHCRHRVFVAATSAPVEPDGALFGVPLAAAGKWPPSGFVRDGLVWEIPVTTCGRRGLQLLPTPTARDADRGAGWGHLPGRPLSEVVCHYRDFAGTKFEAAIRRHEAAGGRRAPSPVTGMANRAGNPQQSAEFPEWMQDLPAGWVSSVVGREDSIRLAGNGVNPRQAAFALSTLPTFRAALAQFETAGMAVAA